MQTESTRMLGEIFDQVAAKRTALEKKERDEEAARREENEQSLLRQLRHEISAACEYYNLRCAAALHDATSVETNDAGEAIATLRLDDAVIVRLHYYTHLNAIAYTHRWGVVVEWSQSGGEKPLEYTTESYSDGGNVIMDLFLRLEEYRAELSL